MSEVEAPDPPRGTLGAGRFAASVAAVTVIGLVLRTAYVLVAARGRDVGLDATWYQLEGGLLNGGFGYIDPGTFYRTGQAVATAAWPPLYPAALAVFIHLGVDTQTGLRLVGLVFAAATIVLTAVLARRVFADDRVALVAAAIVALSPMVVATDMSLMSEVISVPASLLVLLAAHRLVEHRRGRDFVLVGLVAGIGTLGRTDVALLGVLASVVVLVAARAPWREVLRGGVVVVGATALVLLPWVVRNARSVGTATVSTVSTSTAIAGANCDGAYHRPDLGVWEFACIDTPARTPDNESEWSSTILRRGVRYAAEHPGRVPVVAAARVLRVWGAWDPGDLARREAAEARVRGWQVVAWFVEVAVLTAAAAAVIALRARWRTIAVLLAPFAAVTVTALVTYGNQRFRAPAEPALAILAAWMLCHLRDRWRERPHAPA